jgi:hypothetical protein
MVAIFLIGKSDQEAGIGNPFHSREKPRRTERLLGPLCVPAKRMKACFSDFLAFSS